MKTSRNLAISILLTVALIAAPSVIAQPGDWSFDGTSIAQLARNVLDSLASIFGQATATAEPGGLQQEGTDDKPLEVEVPSRIDSTQDSATATAEPGG